MGCRPDKRHRSSSSLGGSNIQNTSSERKVNIRVSIPEVEDQFALAEARCDELQEKIDLVKSLKRKRKLRKRSMTQVPEAQDAVPFISVRTQPKKRLPQVGPRRADAMPQHMHPAVKHPNQATDYRTHAPPPHENKQEEHSKYGNPNIRMKKKGLSRQALAEEEEMADIVSEEGDGVAKVTEAHNQSQRANIRHRPAKLINAKGYEGQSKVTAHTRKKSVLREIPTKEGRAHAEDRSVVELFYKNRCAALNDIKSQSRHRGINVPANDEVDDEDADIEDREHQSRRVKYRSRRYELPTVASQMKQAPARYYTANDYGIIPFIISKSTAPSHNIAVNIQQVLNGFKNQQPLNGIPLTMAYHMGLGHLPDCVSGDVQPSLENRGMNALRLGRRLLRLPDKFVSYNRLLALYREGNSVVSRFLRAINRPPRFYTSMYNLATREDPDHSKTKVWGQSQDGKRSLEEYARVYHEFEQVESNLKDYPNNSDLQRRRLELTKELAEREQYIRQHVLQEHAKSESAPATTLRATASSAEDRYRLSKLNLRQGQ